MKRLLHIALLFFLAASVLSCMSYYEGPDNAGYSDGPNSPVTLPTPVTAVVTVKQDAEGTVFFQLKDYKLLPDVSYTFVRQLRAMASLTIMPERAGEYYLCTVDWLEPVDEGVFTNTAEAPAHSDGIDLTLNSWITEVSDGYMTLLYKTWWGTPPLRHDFYLVSGEDSADPYSLRLIQDSHSDAKDELSEGVICFDINSLPDTGDETKTITLYWLKLDGTTGKASFEFKTRQ